MISDRHLTELMDSMSAKNFTSDTKKNYRSQIVKFGVAYGSQYHKATIAELTKYISDVENANYMAATYSSLKFFYKYVLKQKQKFPFIPFPKKEDRLPDVPSKKQVLSAIDKTDNTKHRLILCLLYGTGIRLSEIVGVRWCDISRTTDNNNPLKILIHGKGNKDRQVCLSEKVYALLKQYCKEYSLGCETRKDEYVLGDKTPYSKRSVAKVVEQAGNRVGIKLHPHLLRHACFTHLRESGVDLEAIAELAGHISHETTRKYARLNPTKITMPI